MYVSVTHSLFLVSSGKNTNKPRQHWISLFLHSLLNMRSTTCTRYATNAELFKPVTVLFSTIPTNQTNGFGESGKSPFQSIQSVEDHNNLWRTLPHRVLRKLVSTGWNSLSFSAAWICTLFSTGYISTYLFTTLNTFFTKCFYICSLFLIFSPRSILLRFQIIDWLFCTSSRHDVTLLNWFIIVLCRSYCGEATSHCS